MTSLRMVFLMGVVALIAVASAFAVGRGSQSEASDPTSQLERVELNREVAKSKVDLKPAAALPALKVEEKPEQVTVETPTETQTTPETTFDQPDQPTPPDDPDPPDPFE